MVGIKNAAPGGAGTPAEGLATTTDKESHMASADLTAPLDGCPSCTCRNNPPLGIESPAPGAVMARYRCRDCGETWWTSWRATCHGDLADGAYCTSCGTYSAGAA